MLRRCPHCGEEKEANDRNFGICRARADGMNLYCKPCTREKIRIHRANLKAKRKGEAIARPKASPPLPVVRRHGVIAEARRGEPEDRVLRALRAGASTQREIVRLTKLTRDEVTDAIAELLLWRKAIGTRIRGERRHYFIKAA